MKFQLISWLGKGPDENQGIKLYAAGPDWPIGPTRFKDEF